MPFQKGHKPPKPFPKGIGGNPSGRPKSNKEFMEACRAHTPEALAVMVRTMRGQGVKHAFNKDGSIKSTSYVPVTPQAQFDAAVKIVERGHGKAIQPIVDTDEDGAPAPLSRIEHVIVNVMQPGMPMEEITIRDPKLKQLVIEHDAHEPGMRKERPVRRRDGDDDDKDKD